MEIQDETKTFKVGDWVLCNDPFGFNYRDEYNERITIPVINEIGVVKTIYNYGDAYVKIYNENLIDEIVNNGADSNENGDRSLYFHKNELTKIPLNNILNKKLYPNRVEYKGFLIPRDLAAKLNEGDNN